jgi:putative oxidoreductase
MKRVLSNKYLILGIRLLLGFVFIYASIDKIAHPAEFAQAIYNYRMLPHWTLNFMALVMPWLELFCGILIAAGVFFRGSAFMIGVMLGVFIIAISSALVRGLDISCGCFSVEGGHGVAVDLLIRDIFMFVGAAIVVFLGTSELTLRRRSN